MDYPGKVITKTQVTPTQTSASGNWTLDDQAAAIKNNNWPVALVPNPISKSLRFNSADSAYLNRTPASAGNRRTWTYSFWVKRAKLSRQMFFGVYTSASDVAVIEIESDKIYWYDYLSAYRYELQTTQVLRDPSAWYHIMCVLDTTQATSSNRNKIYINGSLVTALTTATYPTQNLDGKFNTAVQHSIGTEGSNLRLFLDAYQTETYFIDGQALTPSSFGMTNPQTGQWIPLKYSGTYGTNGFYLNFKDATSTTTLGLDYSGNANNWTTNNFSVGSISSKVLEIVDATKSGSVTLSATVVGSGTVNLTAFGGCGNISGSVFTGIGSLNGLISDWQTHTVYKNGSSLFTVQGGAVNNNAGTQTATQSRTAQTVTQTGISVVSGDVISIAFGANNAVTAYYGYPGGAPSLTIAASSGAFIADGSANDSLTDVPTPWFAYNTTGDVGGVIRGNYATWNPLDRTAATYTNGNLEVSSTSSAAPYNMTTTIQLPTSGKWYCEVTALKGANSPLIGIGNNRPTDQVIGYRSNATYISAGVTGVSSSGTPATWTTGDIIGIAYDAGAGTLSFYKNGSAQSGGFTSIPATGYCVAVRADSASGDGGTLNAGQRPFAYTPPTGFRSLCTTNLPATAIGFGLTNQGDDYFNPVLYTGNGSTQSITGVGFQPDWTWIKCRSAGGSDHYLADAVRGATKYLQSNTTAAEGTNNGLTAFTSDGFSVGAVGDTNANGATFVAWNWKANGTGVSNTAGTITSTVSANTTSGFSIVTYTGNGTNGASVGHGLGVAPSMIIIKNRTDSASAFWCVYHRSAYVSGADPNVLYLNSTAAQADDTNVWGSSPDFSSTIFKLGDYNGSNGSGDSLVAYCFAAVPGYSAFGSYTGNGSTDGPFVYLGFRPEFVMVKRTDGLNEWLMHDSARSTYNVVNARLSAQSSAAESTSPDALDFTSNGFKLRTTDGGWNASGGTYIYMAFAESPFQFANAR